MSTTSPVLTRPFVWLKLFVLLVGPVANDDAGWAKTFYLAFQQLPSLIASAAIDQICLLLVGR